MRLWTAFAVFLPAVIATGTGLIGRDCKKEYACGASGEPLPDDTQEGPTCLQNGTTFSGYIDWLFLNDSDDFFADIDETDCIVTEFLQCGFDCAAGNIANMKRIKPDDYGGVCQGDFEFASFTCDTEGSEVVATQMKTTANIKRQMQASLDKEYRTSADRLFVTMSPLLSIHILNSTNVKTNLTYTMDISKDCVSQNDVEDDEIISDITYVCAFLDQTSAKVATNGCWMTRFIQGENVSCQCNHTTVFALLLSVKPVKISPNFKVRPVSGPAMYIFSPIPHLQIASYIVQSISVLFLLVAFGLLMYVRRLIKEDRVNIQICLVFSLILLHTVNLFHEVALRNSRACIFVAIAMHFLLLSTAMWMLMEGLTLLVKTSKLVLRYNQNVKKIRWIRHVVCWGVPATIVSVSAPVCLVNGSYMKPNPQLQHSNVNSSAPGAVTATEIRPYNQCWIDPTQPVFVGAVIVPLAVIILTNTLIVIRLAYVVYNMESEAKKFRPMSQRNRQGESGLIKTSYLKESMKFAIMLTPVLGLPWIIGFVIIEGTKTAEFFMYANLIINGGQGIFLFILYCVIGTEAKGVIERKLRQKVDSMEFRAYRSKQTENATNKYTTTLDNTMATAGNIRAEREAPKVDDHLQAEDNL